jgi:hypothetical protein
LPEPDLIILLLNLTSLPVVSASRRMYRLWHRDTTIIVLGIRRGRLGVEWERLRRGFAGEGKDGLFLGWVDWVDGSRSVSVSGLDEDEE